MKCTDTSWQETSLEKNRRTWELLERSGQSLTLDGVRQSTQRAACSNGNISSPEKAASPSSPNTI
ncbi:MAG: hypothetical protein ACOZEN_06640 [Thermodesulfobacteriota bacterium]